jgi:DNA polymerase
VPIESVTTDHLLWDGEDWVSHEGVICKGIREVIIYGGLSATADHLVWVEGMGKLVPLGFAAKCGASLARTADGKKAIALGGHQGKQEAPGSNDAPKELGTRNVYDIVNAGRHNRFTVSGVLVHNCGYGGSVGALKAMGALESGMTEDELKPLVDAWRQSNPNIVQLWWDVDQATKEAVKERTTTNTHGIRFSYESGFLFITLPSGRRLAYVKPRIGTNAFGSACVTYEGVGGTKKWERIETYGPKVVENLCQSISRDLLCHAMQQLEAAGCPIVMHIHDEVVIEAPMDMEIDEVGRIMSIVPLWAEGLILDAAGYETGFYMKD